MSSRLQVRGTLLRPRYHQGLRWVLVRESLGPGDDAFRSGRRGSGRGRREEAYSRRRIIRWPSTWSLSLRGAFRKIGPTAFIKALIRFRFGRRGATTDTVIIFISTALTVRLLHGANHRARSNGRAYARASSCTVAQRGPMSFRDAVASRSFCFARPFCRSLPLPAPFACLTRCRRCGPT